MLRSKQVRQVACCLGLTLQTEAVDGDDCNECNGLSGCRNWQSFKGPKWPKPSTSSILHCRWSRWNADGEDRSSTSPVPATHQDTDVNLSNASSTVVTCYSVDPMESLCQFEMLTSEELWWLRLPSKHFDSRWLFKHFLCVTSTSRACTPEQVRSLWMKANMREGRPAMDLLNNLFVHLYLFAYQTCSKIRSKCPERPVNQVRLRSANDPRQCRSSLATEGLCCRCVRPPRKVRMRKARYQVRVQRVQHVHPISKQAAATTFRHWIAWR